MGFVYILEIAAVQATMAQQSNRVARALNSFTEAAFTSALTARDQAALSTFVEDFFCSTPDEDAHDEDDPGNYKPTGIINKVMHVQWLIAELEEDPFLEEDPALSDDLSADLTSGLEELRTSEPPEDSGTEDESKYRIQTYLYTLLLQL